MAPRRRFERPTCPGNMREANHPSLMRVQGPARDFNPSGRADSPARSKIRRDANPHLRNRLAHGARALSHRGSKGMCGCQSDQGGSCVGKLHPSCDCARAARWVFHQHGRSHCSRAETAMVTKGAGDARLHPVEHGTCRSRTNCSKARPRSTSRSSESKSSDRVSVGQAPVPRRQR
jgi:hypothetical protein